MAGRAGDRTHPLEPYVPRILAEWELDAPGRAWQGVEGTLCFVDISGFTNLSEKLARRGRIGAEELTEVLDRVFGDMLELAYDRGGSLLKFGGDALLLMFEGEGHAIQGTCAAVEMRAALRQAVKIPTSVGRIRLRMSVGVHTGPIELYRVGDIHQELVVTGETATVTTEMEATADAGDIVISPQLCDLLPADAAGDPKGGGRILRWQRPRVEPSGPTRRRPMPDATYENCVPAGLRDSLSVERAEAEHRVATVGFIKFKGIEAVLSDAGADGVAAGLDQLATAVQREAHAESVTFLATDIDEDGGKIILSTGVPTTGDDDEGRMLRALRRIADSRQVFSLKIGANRGHVFAGEIGTAFRSTYTVMGDTVNLAARLMAAAPAGGVYVSPAVLDRSTTLFRTAPLKPFFVKGKAQPIQAYEVFEETGHRPPEARHELPFGGRLSELAHVLDAWTTPGRRVITISGDTGIGKSRLVVEALDRHGPSATLRIQGEPNSTSNPYWAFRDPLRNLLRIQRRSQAEMIADLTAVIRTNVPRLEASLPLLGDVLHIEIPDNQDTEAIDPRYRPDRTADAVIELLDGVGEHDLAIVLEDAHWVDEPSMGLARRIANAAADRDWAMVVTTRFLPRGGALGEHVPLGPVAENDLRSIAIDATSAAPLRPHELAAIIDRAGGNPLFLTEILRVVRDIGSTGELPESLDAVVSSQIDTLPTLTRQLLRYASVLGRSFRRVVLDEFLEPEGIVIDQATRQTLARFVTTDGATRFRFRHAVVHGAAYQGLSYRRRRELHARAGAVIERLAGADTEAVAEFLAFHYAEGGDHEKAWRYGIVAGDRAKANYANIEAAEHYRRALSAGKNLRVSLRAELAVLKNLGDVLEQAALYGDAVASYTRAARLTDDPVAVADIRLRCARARMRLGSYRSALGDITRATKAITENGRVIDPSALARLVSFRAVIHQSQQRAEEALRLARQAESLARDSGESEALARSLGVMDWASWMLGRPDEASNSDEAIEIYLRLGDLDLAANLLNNTGGFAYFEGRWNEALALYRRSREAFDRAGNVAGAALVDANMAEILVSRGDVVESRPLVENAVRVLQSTDSTDDLLFAEMQLARFFILDGDTSQAVERIRRLTETANREGRSGFAIELTVLLAEAYNSAGDASAALGALDEFPAGDRQATSFFASQVALERARALNSMGRLADALAEIAVGMDAASEHGLIYDRYLLLEQQVAAQRSAAQSADETVIEELAALGAKLGLNAANPSSVNPL